nr:hypothetical protein [Tanacetum cinerariifolium]
LINQVNKKSVEISDLNANLQEQGLIITALQDELRKLKGKALVDNDITTLTFATEMLKADVEPIAFKLLNNRTVHSDYLRHTQEQAVILKEVVEQGKSQNPLNNSLDHALASLIFWQWQQPSLAVGTYTASGNTEPDSGNALCILFPTILP